MEFHEEAEKEDIPSSGDEDETDYRKHSQLLDAISALDGKKKQRLSQRTVVSNQISEFNFTSSKDHESRVKLHELVGSLKESTSHGELKKQLRTIDKGKKTVSTPLARHEKEKIDRSTAYETVKEDLSKWDPIVKKNRKADQLEFPLQKQDFRVVSTTQLVKKFQPRTPLERQVAELLQGSECVIQDREQELTPAEQRALKAMNLEEAKQRRLELMKHRALLSYKEAKAKRQKKIKSKRYHKILKKERLKNEKKALEKLEETDPEGYLEKLNQLERDRAQERVSLKHRGGGKFARRQMIYAKYDDRARQEVQDMLQKSRELTKKVEDDSDSDMEEKFPDSGVVSDITIDETGLDLKSDNPWMAKPGGRNTSSQFARPVTLNSLKHVDNDEVSEYSRPKELVNEGKTMKSDDESKGDDSEDEEIIQRSDDEKTIGSSTGNFLSCSKSEVHDLSSINFSEFVEHSETDINNINDIIDEIFDIKRKEKAKIEKSKAKNKRNKAKKKAGKMKVGTAAKANPNIESKVQTVVIEGSKNDSDEDEDESSVEKEDGVIAAENDRVNKMNNNSFEDDEIKDINNEGEDDSFVNAENISRKRTLEDLDNISSDEETEKISVPKKMKSSKEFTKKLKKPVMKDSKENEPFVDPKQLLTVESQIRETGIVPAVVDHDDDEEDDPDSRQRMTIAQAFAEDDVIEEFTQEKEDIIEKGKPKDIDLTLPGWGSWGGEGVQVSKKKRKRFIIKAPPPLPRKDEHLGHVILNEARHTAVSKHRVNEIPFPYRNVEQFEKSIRAPLGKTWNPETVHQELVKPKLVTAIGKIIAPMDKSEVFKNQKSKVKNDLEQKQIKSGQKPSRKDRRKKFVKKPGKKAK